MGACKQLSILPNHPLNAAPRGLGDRVREGMLWNYGLDTNDRQQRHVLRALLGRAISAMHHICRVQDDTAGLIQDTRTSFEFH
jgi:hypothetical protein